jgi:hypothetical protein
MEYRLLIDLEVVEILQRFSKRAREDFLDHFDKIRDFPSIIQITTRTMLSVDASKYPFIGVLPFITGSTFPTGT